MAIYGLSFGKGIPNDSTHYQKGSLNFGLMFIPNILTLSHPNYGFIGLNLNPSISYFVLKNTEISFSVFSVNRKYFIYNDYQIFNIVELNPYIRYYFLKSKLFGELGYFYGIYSSKGISKFVDYTNNFGWGIGYNQTIINNFGRFNHKFSWEFAIKGAFETNNNPLGYFQIYKRLALIYHF